MVYIVRGILALGLFCLSLSLVDINGRLEILYFFGYKTEIFSFQNNPKSLDPSYKIILLYYSKISQALFSYL